MLATFGRGFYILDDYSALREMTRAGAVEEARLFPLRDAYLFSPTGMAPAGVGGHRRDGRQLDRAQPAVRRGVHLQRQQELPADAKLVLTISDETGKQIRRLDVPKGVGLRRVAWNLRGEAPEAAGRAGAAARQEGQEGREGRQAEDGAVHRRGRWCRPDATERSSANRLALMSLRSVNRRHFSSCCWSADP